MGHTHFLFGKLMIQWYTQWEVYYWVYHFQKKLRTSIDWLFDDIIYFGFKKILGKMEQKTKHGIQPSLQMKS